MSRQLPHFGPYQAIRRLGAGGMAETFEAVRRGPGGFEQRVCIKRILPAYADDRDFVESFLREACTSASLRHANIVQVLDFGEADGSYYLALELIDGLDLRAVLGASGPERRGLEPEVAVLIAGELAAALDHAHAGRAPVVHRDLSPSNTLISCAGEVKLTDFGIARALDGRRFTATGVIKGKVPYLPPEYIEHGRFDQRSDLFALGVLLFELIAGERPFDGESEIDTIRRIVAGESKSLGELAPHTPPALVACVEQLIAPDPTARCPSAEVLLERLPAIHVHQARTRLAGLVQTRIRELSTPTAPSASAPEATPSLRAATAIALTQAAPQPSLESPPSLGPSGRASAASQVTRTSLRPRAERAVSRGVWVALGAAGVALLAVLLGFTLRTLRPDGSTVAAAPPPLPRARALSGRSAEPPASSEPAPAGEAPFGQEGTELAGTLPASTPVPAASERARAHAELRVVVLPFGDVWVDGKALGHAPISLKLPPGNHEVAVGDGRPEQHRSLSLRSGEHESVVFRRTQ